MESLDLHSYTDGERSECGEVLKARLTAGGGKAPAVQWSMNERGGTGALAGASFVSHAFG